MNLEDIKEAMEDIETFGPYNSFAQLEYLASKNAMHDVLENFKSDMIHKYAMQEDIEEFASKLAQELEEEN